MPIGESGLPVVKSVVFLLDGGVPILVVIDKNARICADKLADTLGTTAAQLKLAPRKELVELCGNEPENPKNGLVPALTDPSQPVLNDRRLPIPTDTARLPQVSLQGRYLRCVIRSLSALAWMLECRGNPALKSVGYPHETQSAPAQGL